MHSDQSQVARAYINNECIATATTAAKVATIGVIISVQAITTVQSTTSNNSSAQQAIKTTVQANSTVT